VFVTYADGSATLHGLAEALTRRGVPTPTGLRLWSPATLHGILTNPAYIGQAVAQRYQTRTPQQRHSPLLPIGRTRERHSSPSRPREEWIVVPIPALVPEAHFVAAQQRLVHNRVVARRNLKHKYLLQGLVSCGHCRLCCFVRARGRTVAPGESQYHYYLCRGKQASVTSRHEQLCPSRFIPAAELDALVWADLCTVLQTPEILAEALQRARTGAWLPETVQQQYAGIRTAHKSLERQQERLLDAYVAGLLDLAAFEKRQRGVADRMAELAARERELLAQGQRLLDTAKILASMTEVCARLRQNLEATTFEQRRELVELLIDRVVVTDDDVEIRYAVPTTDSSLHTRFGQLRQDYLDHPASRQQHESALGLGVLDDFQADAVGLGVRRRLVAGVALVDEGQRDRLAGDLLDGLGQLGDLLSVLLIGRRDVQGQQVPEGVHGQVDLRAVPLLRPVVPGPPAALRGALERPTIEDDGTRRRITPAHQAQDLPQVVHQCLEAAGRDPALTLLVHQLPRRQVRRQ
jgi:site-specific DNA recombinase